MNGIKKEYLNTVYKELAEIVGIENSKKIYDYYKGLEINFPTRFYSKEYCVSRIIQEYNGENIQLLARKYNYSQRWIRNILKENK